MDLEVNFTIISEDSLRRMVDDTFLIEEERNVLVNICNYYYAGNYTDFVWDMIIGGSLGFDSSVMWRYDLSKSMEIMNDKLTLLETLTKNFTNYRVLNKVYVVFKNSQYTENSVDFVPPFISNYTAILYRIKNGDSKRITHKEYVSELDGILYNALHRFFSNFIEQYIHGLLYTDEDLVVQVRRKFGFIDVVLC